MNFRKGQGREDPEINLIPFIDVLLVILIFLMITTTYSKFTALQITLPTADAEKMMARPPEINVGIDAQGHYLINNARISYRDVAGLADDLRNTTASAGQAKKEPVIIINADARAARRAGGGGRGAARGAGGARGAGAARAS